MSTLADDTNDTLNRLAGMAGRLYSLPGVAIKVLELTDSPDADSATLKECVEKDPALTAKILRVVNSSLYSPSRPIADLGQALALLGSKPLKLLVLGFSLPSDLFDGLEAKILAMYWRHSLTKAVAARELMEKVLRRPGDEAFIAGLLQDLGMLVLIQTLQAPYQRLVEKIRECCEDLYDRERELIGFDHTALSARLLRQWQMPDSLIDAIELEAGGELRESGLPPAVHRVLATAETLARVLADDRPDLWPQAVEQLTSLGSDSPTAPDALLREIQEKVQQLAEIFAVRLPPQRSVESILAAAQVKMAEMAEAMLMGCGGAGGRAARHPLDAGLDDALRQCVQALPRDPAATGERVARRAGPTAHSPRESARQAPSTPHQQATDAAEPRQKQAALADRTLDPGLMGRLRAAVAMCRRDRVGLSLLLAEFADGPSLLMTLGPPRLSVLRRIVEAACESLEHAGSEILPCLDFGCAWILPDCDRKTAVEYGYQLNRVISRLPRAEWPTAKGITLQIGVAYVATPAPNFPPEDLYTAARRCLAASAASGGSVVKSIEIY